MKFLFYCPHLWALTFLVPACLTGEGGCTYKMEFLLLENNMMTNSSALALKQTIQTERSPLVGEVNANFCG
jgi:hypothetical protein